MPSRSGSEAGIAPVLTVLSLLASAGVLVGGFYVADTLYDDRSGGMPEVGVWADDSKDRILVVSGDQDADWQGLELKTDRPARAKLGGDATLTDGTLSPGGKFVPLSDSPQQVVGGDSLSICAVAQEGPMEVTVRDAASKAVVFGQSMDVERCEHGVGTPDADDAAGETVDASSTATDATKGGKGSGKGSRP